MPCNNYFVILYHHDSVKDGYTYHILLEYNALRLISDDIKLSLFSFIPGLWLEGTGADNPV